MKDLAQRLVLKQRHKVPQKWPIKCSSYLIEQLSNSGIRRGNISSFLLLIDWTNVYIQNASLNAKDGCEPCGDSHIFYYIAFCVRSVSG